jgi:hypothetical protein
MFLVLTLLLGLTLGCGLIRGKEETPPPPAEEAPAAGEEAPSPTEAPSVEEAEPEEVESEEESEEAESGEEEVEEIDVSSITGGLGDLDSYRSHFEMSFQDTSSDEAEVWTLVMDTEYIRDPFAQRVVIGGSDAEGGLESVRIGDQQYFVFGEEDECMSSSVGEGEPMETELFEPDDFFGELGKARRVRPDEEVNGILCRHYTFDETFFTWDDISSAEGEMWVAVDGDYVVKHVLEAEGKNPTTGEEGHIEWLYEVNDINGSFSIEPPADCEAAESEFPVMVDAIDLSTLAGMVTYNSPSSFDDVLAFYQEEMVAWGWSEGEGSFVSEGTAMLSYTKDGDTVTVMLTGEEGTVSVVIMGE